MAENLYNLMEELVVTEHEAQMVEKRKELAAFATELYKNFTTLVNQYEAATKNTADDTTKSVKDEKAQIIRDMQTLLQESQTKIKSYCDDMVLRVGIKADKILNNVEQFRGPQGIAGRPGENGKDGSPDTPDQVVEKVNTAGKKVKLSAIEGLSEELRKVRRENVGKIGGGMGNPQHETHAVGSGTTAITLSYPVAANGRAIWPHYQGQWLVYGTHYTVSGRSMSLLFTPTDGTYIDVLYTRGS